MTFDLSKLKGRCQSPIKSFHKEGVVTHTKDGVYIYKDNGSNVLAIAHLDTVIDVFSWRVKEKRQRIYCPMFDDRAGAYVILDLLPTLGIKYDILLTEGEEMGQSTAKHFKPPEGKKYNWMFQFDRKGEDVVYYGYDDEPWKAVWKAHGFSPAWGSRTDISVMEDLGVKAANIGTGYHNEHTQDCYLDLKELERQVNRFVNFYNANVDKAYAHTKKVYSGYENYNRSTGYYAGRRKKQQRALVSLRYMPSVFLMIGDREVSISIDALVNLMTPVELKDLLGDGVVEMTFPASFLRDIDIAVYGDSQLIGGKEEERDLDYYGV